MRKMGLIVLILTLMAGGQLYSPGSTASASPLNVSIGLQNTTPVLDSVIGFGGEVDPFMFFNHETITGVDDDDLAVFATRIKKTGVSFVRMWLQSEWWEPNNDNNDPFVIDNAGFTWDSPEMKSLYKYLDVFKENGVSVLIDSMGGNMTKLYPWLYWSPDISHTPRPDKVDEFAENTVALLKHLVVTKGYSNVKFASIYNEPEAFFVPPPGYDKLEYHKTLNMAVYDRLQAEGLGSVKLVGAENMAYDADGKAFYTDYTQTMGDYMDGYTLHFSPTSAMMENGSAAADIADLLALKNTNDPNGTAKPLIFSENGDNEVKATVDAGLNFASLVAHSLRMGVGGISQWRLNDELYPPLVRANQTMTGESDFGGGWWTHKQDNWTPYFKYYIASLITKYIRPGAATYATTSSDEKVNAAVVKMGADKHTILVVNWNTEPVQASFALQQPLNTTFRKFEYGGSVVLDTFGRLLPSSGSVAVNGTAFTDSIPARSVVLYTNISDPTSPSGVSGLTASAPSASQVNLAWTANADTDLAYYRIYRDTISGFTPSAMNQVGEIWIKPGDTPAFHDRTVKPGTKYYYKVTAVDEVENEGAASAQADAATPQRGYSNALTVTDDVQNGFYEIHSDRDSGYTFRVSKLTGVGQYAADIEGTMRNNITVDSYSIPRVLKYSANAYVDKIANGGAESGASAPDSWNCYMDDPAGTCSWDTGIAHTGGKSLKVTVNNPDKHGTWHQNISDITGGKYYFLSYFVRTDQVAKSDFGGSGAYAGVTFRDSSGNPISEGGATLSIGGTKAWTYKYQLFYAPANAVSANVGVRVWGTTGSAWYDDIQFYEIAEAAIDGNQNKPAGSIDLQSVTADHKRIVTVKESETLQYDFYPERIDITVTGSNPGGYFVEDGGFQPRDGGSVLWSDGTTSDLSLLSPGSSVEKSATSAAFRQWASPYLAKYDFGASAKQIRWTNGSNSRGYYPRFQLNSGQTFSISFPTDNKFANAGAENGSSAPSGWSSWTNGDGTFQWDAATAHWGSKALKITNPGANTSLWYQQMASPDLTREISASGWVKTSSVSGGDGAFISLVAKDAAGNILAEHRSPVQSGTSDWKELTVRMTPPRNTATIDAGGALWDSTGQAWFDDLRYQAADNAVKNPGGEKGAGTAADDWSTFTTSGTPFGVDAAVAHTGGRSLKIAQASGAASSWSQQLFNLQKIQEYEFGGWVKTSGVTGGNGAFIALVAKDINGSIIQEGWTSIITGTQDWTFVRGKLILPPLTESVSIEGRLWGSSGTAWFDDIDIKLLKR